MRCCCAFFLFAAAPALLLATETTQLHVALNGNDAWSGRPAEPNADQTDGPLATISGARDAIRKLRRRERSARGCRRSHGPRRNLLRR